MSDQKLRISLITLTYNERENIALLAEEIFGVLKGHPAIDLELIVVDDNSPDGTGEVAESLTDRACASIALLSRTLAFRTSDRGILTPCPSRICPR